MTSVPITLVCYLQLLKWALREVSVYQQVLSSLQIVGNQRDLAETRGLRGHWWVVAC